MAATLNKSFIIIGVITSTASAAVNLIAETWPRFFQSP